MRFTQTGPSDGGTHAVYALVLDRPPSRQISIPVVEAVNVQRVRILGVDEPLEILTKEGTLIARLPERFEVPDVTALNLGPGVRAHRSPPHRRTHCPTDRALTR